MKIKREFYCLVDRNNKPDLRYLFEDQAEAQRKLQQVKNSIQGETLFLPNNRRDYFVDGVQRKFIEAGQKAEIRRGCWSAVQVRKATLVDNIKPERIFQSVKKSKAYNLEYSKKRIKERATVAPIKMPSLPKIPVETSVPAFQVNSWSQSFLKTRPLTGTLATLCLIAFTSIFTINYRASSEMSDILIKAQAEAAQKSLENQTKVLGAKDKKLADQFEGKFDEFVLSSLAQFETVKAEELEGEIMKIIANSPMEKMAPLIAKQDRKVAAFLIGIAKKESNLGRRVPVLNGQDCYNYWGYRGIRDRMGTGGHTCFDSPEDAIATVGGRLQRLVQSDVDTPAEMVLWKCGSNCASDAGAAKWIKDVDMYFQKIDNNGNNG
ncbi:MAG TPA: hypothetical protein GX706_03235 [Candidatus Moranbacteria bacterium]|nr:hypothetical protein [Candidatus Moranbacteria bacterium]